MPFLSRASIGALAVITIAVVTFILSIQDNERISLGLKTAIESNSNFTAEFTEPFKWSFSPAPTLQISDFALHDKQTKVSIAQLELQLNWSALWTDPSRWQIKNLDVTQAAIRRGSRQADIGQLTVSDFAVGHPSSFFLAASVTTTAGAPPINSLVEGQFIVGHQTKNNNHSIKFTQLTLHGPTAEGKCKGEIHRLTPTNHQAAATNNVDQGATTLLPLNALRPYDFQLNCLLKHIRWGGESVGVTSLELEKAAGQIAARIDAQEFLEGTFSAVVNIDTQRQPLHWHITPRLEDINSERLVAYSGQGLTWASTLGADSTITLSGNSREALLASLSAKTQFNSGRGKLSIAKIKQQLEQISLLNGQAQTITKWPEPWTYAWLGGQWTIDGTRHQLKLTIDNVSLEASGTYSDTTKTFDLLGNITFKDPVQDNGLKINRLLMGIPLPFQCKGTVFESACEFDSKGAKKLLANALRQGDDSALRQKLETKINENVPEAYRETARGILDLLGRALEND